METFKHTLVVHASDLPRGRGWSPQIWSVLNGDTYITVSLIEAADRVDAGSIWAKRGFSLEGHELYDEINKKFFDTEIELMEFAIENFLTIQPQKQNEEEASYFPRRTPSDSRLDADCSIRDQFNLLRVCDPHRYPAFVELHGHIYDVILRKRNIY